MDAIQLAKIKGYKTIEIGTGNSGSRNWLCIKSVALESMALIWTFLLSIIQKQFLRTEYSAEI